MPASLLTNRFFLVSCLSLITTLVLSGCDVENNNNLPNVPQTGYFMYAEANLHDTVEDAQVAAAVFIDGEPVNLVGGDIFAASTETDSTLLLSRGYYDGTYSASLPMTSLSDIFMQVIHEPIEAREDRWYPVDLVNIDPGPGELVGTSATISFPPEIIITSPTEPVKLFSINDTIELTWVPAGMGDNMRALASVECTDGLAVTRYGVSADINDDDGHEILSLSNIIFDSREGAPVLNFISEAALVLLQDLLNQLSAGNIDPDYVYRNTDANPAESTCDIRIFVQRLREGIFDDAFDSGSVTGGRSTEIQAQYTAVNPLDN